MIVNSQVEASFDQRTLVAADCEKRVSVVHHRPLRAQAQTVQPLLTARVVRLMWPEQHTIAGRRCISQIGRVPYHSNPPDNAHCSDRRSETL